MNALMQNQMATAETAIDQHGESPSQDRRAFTSPRNGARHQETDWKLAAQEFVAKTGRAVEWRREGYYVYEPQVGAYRLRTEREVGALISSFLPATLSNGQRLQCSANAERNILVALRGTEKLDLLPSCFLSTGKSAGSWVAMHNGILDIEAAARGEHVELQPHSPDFFSTFARPFDWAPNADCPMWKTFLAQAVPDPADQAMLQMMLGYLLVEDTSYQVFFDLIGSGQNGKGVFKAVVQALIGLENICRIPLADFTEKFVIGELTLKRVNFVGDSETQDYRTYNRAMGRLEGVLKEVTGGPDATMKLEPKGVQADTARPVKARCVFLTNSLTPWTDRSHAIWRRWRLIPFFTEIDDGQVDPHLAKKIIAAELPGIFRWAVEGLGLLRQKKTFPFSPKGLELMQGQRETCNPEKTYLTDRLEFRSGSAVESMQVYQDYVGWCKLNGYDPLNSGMFASEVRRVFPGVIGPKKKRINGEQRRRYVNLAFVAEPSPTSSLPPSTATTFMSEDITTGQPEVPAWSSVTRTV